MKATGIIRRIDELGRIVIPKEIRKTMKVKVGMPLEIYTDQDGGIILKKYLPFTDFSSLAKEYAECMATQTRAAVMITDREKVIAAVGCGKSSLEGREITQDLENVLDDRDETLPESKRKTFLPVIDEMEIMKSDLDQTYSLIRSDGEIIGAVFLITKSKDKKIGELEKKVAVIAADFLGKQVSI